MSGAEIPAIVGAVSSVVGTGAQLAQSPTMPGLQAGPPKQPDIPTAQPQPMRQPPALPVPEISVPQVPQGQMDLMSLLRALGGKQ